ncbi:MAG TPA: hypothetical protein VME01_06610, partial [Solirubrobacteraceae bacterium]|nr:hypothetical protein [Solirubrobacteraceae bacterium]
FVVPSTQQFSVYLNAPYQHGIRYLITVPPVGFGAIDALNRYYPGLYEDCIRNTQLVAVVDSTGVNTQYRIYRLLGPISPSTLVYDTTDCPIPTTA